MASGLVTRPSDRGFADWTCEGSSQDGDTAYVQLAFNRDNRLEDDGRPTSLAGTTDYVAPGGESRPHLRR
ncbi:hypothetical protein [Streptomyces chartreusis]|uniref:hypothetical protein n=1 Tax=Streptomyces chartreusis TaxID=1969 RepID=UPI00381F0907